MKKLPSIRDIFANWKRLTFLSLLLLVMVALTVVSDSNSYNKSTNLLGQKQLANEIASIGRGDLELASIQYRGKSTQLQFEYEKLVDLDGYDLMGRLFLNYSEDYRQDLDILKARVLEFNQAAGAWYGESEQNLAERERALQNARYALLSQIDSMIFQNIGYDIRKFEIQQWLVYASLLTVFLLFAYYALRFRTVFNDIHSLYSVETKGDEYQIVTEEIDVISKRMSRKSTASENPALMDPITEISNYKGLLHSFANRKGKEGSTLGICVFEIDDFKNLDRQYPKSFTQGVLKKIAFMLSLHEQHTDILARTDYSQFTMVLSRQNLNQALEACENIRKAVEETAFKIPQGGSVNLTISGGLVQKSSNVSLEESIQIAKDTLSKAVHIGKNSIKQPKDVVSV